MRILHIGCSWSEIDNYQGNHSSVPQEFSKLLNIQYCERNTVVAKQLHLLYNQITS